MVFLKHGLYLLNRIIIFIRRCLGMSTATTTSTLANLYSLFQNILLEDQNLQNDQSLYKFSPKYIITEPSSELLNQSSLNDISVYVIVFFFYFVVLIILFLNL